MCKAKEITIELSKYINETKQTYEKNKVRISNLELEENDLKHEIELAKLDAVKFMKTCIKYKNVLNERRKLKDENATLIYLYDMFDKMPDLPTKLQKTMNNIDEKINQISERVYVPKARKDLTIGKPIDFSDLKEKLESRNVG